MMKFYAMFKGVDLDAEAQDKPQDRLKDIKRRANARLAGKTEEEASRESFADFGIEVETI